MLTFYLTMILITNGGTRMEVQNFNNNYACVNAGNAFIAGVENINALNPSAGVTGSYTCTPTSAPGYNVGGVYVQ